MNARSEWNMVGCMKNQFSVSSSQFSEKAGLLRTENWKLRTGEKIDERAVEILGRFFVGQMTNALKCYQTGIAKIPAQRLGGMESNGAVSGSPEEKSRVIANLGERS